MGLTHWMQAEEQADDAVLFSCPEPGCGRRVIVGGEAGFRVIDAGDFYASHVGAKGGVSLSADLPSN